MRLPRLAPEDFTPAQKELSDRITARRGGTRGPFLVWLRSPGLCERVEALGAYARFESQLPEKLRELSLLIAARYFDAQYSWNAHVDKAVAAGIAPEAIATLARRERPVFADEADQVFFDFCWQVLDEHFVDDETFAAALEHFGDAGLVDTIGCLGNFSMLSMLLNTFQVDLQPDRQPPYPDIRGYARVEPARTAARPSA
jgi:4-carboxymuconolactone decarboxylase